MAIKASNTPAQFMIVVGREKKEHPTQMQVQVESKVLFLNKRCGHVAEHL
jgi:hypothetical protein